jgi:hypothetical protein
MSEFEFSVHTGAEMARQRVRAVLLVAAEVEGVGGQNLLRALNSIPPRKFACEF